MHIQFRPELNLMTSNFTVFIFFVPLMTHLCNRYDRNHLREKCQNWITGKHKVTLQPLLPLPRCRTMMHEVGRQSWLLDTLLKFQNMLMKMKPPDLKRRKNDLPDASSLDVLFHRIYKSPLGSSSPPAWLFQLQHLLLLLIHSPSSFPQCASKPSQSVFISKTSKRLLASSFLTGLLQRNSTL